jgi:formamidopyrimidine-DNA glycosylase
MPELPEVQTIIDDLNRKIKGETIVGFWTDWGKTIHNQTAKEFTKAIKNRKILGAKRIGKNIFIDLSGGKTLYIHLKMTGHLLVKSLKLKVKSEGRNYFSDRVNQYVHHKWFLNSGIKNYDKILEFSDLRKFGKIVLLDTSKIKEYKDIKNLGVDAMSPEFNFAYFNKILDKRQRAPIGIVLMDQNLIAGIGNIYRSEILFGAGILPGRKIGTLNVGERKKIFGSIDKILKKAIKYRGTSDSDYRDTSGAPGGYQNILKVYRREKQKCKICGTIISRETLGQRSVFFCPSCQK